MSQVASGLLSLGVKPGQWVGLMLPRTPDLAVAFLAIVRVGAVAVPINHKLQTKWIEAQLQGISTIVGDPALASVLPPSVSGERRPVSCAELIDAGAGSVQPAHSSTADTVCYLNCTSGSTGRPKRAVTTHEQILANARATVQASSQRPDDVFWCLFAPFAHPHEFFHRSLVSGAAFVMIDTMSPRVVTRVVSHHAVSHMLVLPGFAELWLDSGHLADVRDDLRLIEAGGSVVTPELHQRMGAALSGTFAAVWGSTETTGVALTSSGQGGEILDGYALQVIDEVGHPVPQGEVGELCLGGPAVVSSYGTSAEDEASPFGNGWFRTGDLVRVDPDGRVHILGRRSTLLKVGGERVYPAEVERVLREHAQVHDAVVVGVADRRRGEVPVAAVVAASDLAADPGSLQRHCRARLAAHKIPRRIVLLGELPRLPSGKVDRQAVVALLS